LKFWATLYLPFFDIQSTTNSSAYRSMDPAVARSPSDTEIFEKPVLKRRSSTWKPDPQQALVYRAESDDLAFEDVTEINSQLLEHDSVARELTLWLEISNSFEVQLPRWRNRVYVYADKKSKTGFVATIRLDRLGPVKNLQRRLGLNYRTLHVKGNKLQQAYWGGGQKDSLVWYLDSWVGGWAAICCLVLVLVVE